MPRLSRVRKTGLTLDELPDDTLLTVASHLNSRDQVSLAASSRRHRSVLNLYDPNSIARRHVKQECGEYEGDKIMEKTMSDIPYQTSIYDDFITSPGCVKALDAWISRDVRKEKRPLQLYFQSVSKFLAIEQWLEELKHIDY